MELSRASTQPALAGSYAPIDKYLSSISYMDVSAAYRWNILTFRVGVNNLADKNPPLILNGSFSDCPNTSCNDNTWVGTYDTLGRYLYAHVSVKF